MQQTNYNRPHLINQLSNNFWEDFKVSMEAFSDDHQVEVCDALLEIAERFEKDDNIKDLYKTHIDPLLVKHKRKMTEFSNRRLTDYFLRNSMRLSELMRIKKIDTLENHFLTDEEYEQFMFIIKNLIGNHRYYTLLRMPADGDVLENQKSEEESGSEKNKNFTARRRALFFHYLDKHFRISADRKPLAEIVHFLTGNSEDNLYKYLRNPLEISGDDKKGKSTMSLKNDLSYVKGQFVRLGIFDITKTIEKDINSF